MGGVAGVGEKAQGSDLGGHPLRRAGRGGEEGLLVPARAVIDASVLLASLLPDEPTHAEARELLELALLPPGKAELLSTTLLPYELVNGLWQAVRQGRLTPEDVDEVLPKYELFEIPLHPIRPKTVIA